MKKRKLKNKPFLQKCYKKFHYWNFAFLLLLFGFTTPILGQDCNAVSLSINPNNAQTIDIAGLIAPHYIVKVYDENWNHLFDCLDNCTTTVGAYDPGLYRIHVQLYDANWQLICETDFLEITIPCQTICERDEIRLNSQAEVDAFCGCEVVAGDLIITGNVTSLAPLNGLKQVKGSLVIFKTELTDFSGLESLETVEVALNIRDNLVLKNLKGLENLAQIKTLFVIQNPTLETLEGINVSSVGIIDISVNAELISIQALRNIQSLISLQIGSNKKLPNLEGLNNLTNLGDGTTRFPQDLGSSSLVIFNNESLENLDALEHLKNLDERLLLEGNPSLNSCCGIAHLLDDDPNNGIIKSEKLISNNRAGCNSVAEILEHCGGGTVADCEDIIVSINPNNPQTIDIAGLTAPNYIVKVYDENWNRLFDCSTNCSTALGAYNPGLYRVHVILFDEDWQLICETNFLEIQVSGVSNGSNYYQIQQQFKSTESRLSLAKKVDFYLNEKAIAVFPNPVQHTLTVQTKALKGRKGTIQIYNAFGQQIESQPTKVFDQEFESIKVENYQNGLYYLNIKAENLPLISKKFLVEKME